MFGGTKDYPIYKVHLFNVILEKRSFFHANWKRL